MHIDRSQLEALEAALEKLDEVDPASLPEPAAELADLLSEILEDLEQ